MISAKKAAFYKTSLLTRTYTSSFISVCDWLPVLKLCLLPLKLDANKLLHLITIFQKNVLFFYLNFKLPIYELHAFIYFFLITFPKIGRKKINLLHMLLIGILWQIQNTHNEDAELNSCEPFFLEKPLFNLMTIPRNFIQSLKPGFIANRSFITKWNISWVE